MEYIDLDVWKQSRRIVTTIYELTGKFPKEEQFGLTSQMRRSAISIPSNIAEGCVRRTSKDTLQFLHIARGSLYELETQLYLTLDLNYIDYKEHKITDEQITICKKLLNGFMNYYKKQKL
ncbi:four helix bundle protein [Aquimarina sp. ERC-38]|uniref:four helix bundle protein n=1 Tax=Aquimarina sp. ERC-38 TaxID=2949996 RepID=UPI0022462E60|nr:four helix bundle protein [Aquimarina sp. ERC-38]UZO80990.1 four helix bundle protein [Aquimarina sp. ERC-38]